LDENKKEYPTNRVKQEFVAYSTVIISMMLKISEIKWRKVYDKNKVKNLYQERKTNNNNVFPLPQIVEKGYSVNQYIWDKLNNEYENRKKNKNNISTPLQIIENSNLVEVNNKLNISSSSSSSSRFSSIYSLGFSYNFIPFTSLKSCDLCHSAGVLTVIDVDSNNEDTIDRLLKIRDNIPIQKDNNSVIYALLSQINPLKYGSRTLAQTLDSYFILKDSQLQLYLQQFRVIDVQNRNTYTLEDTLYIGRKGLGPIATNFRKVIICFQTGRCTPEKVPVTHAVLHFPDTRHHFYI
jgi:hypothetical protein